MLPYAVLLITSALIFYTIGVWSEKIQGVLREWHLIIFALGLICDTLGTTLMKKIAHDQFQLNFHGITGLSAILLMFFHVSWATLVIAKDNNKAKLNFHKFSFGVWLIWLIPFISGAGGGMAR